MGSWVLFILVGTYGYSTSLIGMDTEAQCHNIAHEARMLAMRRELAFSYACIPLDEE